jgi:hypothetical protein
MGKGEEGGRRSRQSDSGIYRAVKNKVCPAYICREDIKVSNLQD